MRTHFPDRNPLVAHVNAVCVAALARDVFGSTKSIVHKTDRIEWKHYRLTVRLPLPGSRSRLRRNRTALEPRPPLRLRHPHLLHSIRLLLLRRLPSLLSSRQGFLEG